MNNEHDVIDNLTKLEHIYRTDRNGVGTDSLDPVIPFFNTYIKQLGL